MHWTYYESPQAMGGRSAPRVSSTSNGYRLDTDPKTGYKYRHLGDPLPDFSLQRCLSLTANWLQKEQEAAAKSVTMAWPPCWYSFASPYAIRAVALRLPVLHYRPYAAAYLPLLALERAIAILYPHLATAGVRSPLCC